MTSTAPPPAAAIDVTAHLEWAKAVARGVGRVYLFRPGSQEVGDLTQFAYLMLVRYARAFDAERVPVGGNIGGAFRGYCHRALRKELQREARRLRNGGVYHTRRELPGVALIAVPMSGLDAGGAEAGPWDVAEPEHRSEALPDLDPADPPSRFCVCEMHCTCPAE
jgi:hypothetical protein